MIDRGIASYVQRAELAGEIELVDWDAYRKCPTCLQATGLPCVALNGAVAGGRPDGKRAALPHAHAHRRRRAGR